VDILKRAKEIIGIERDALASLADSINGNFTGAVDLMLETTGRVVVTGMGKSGMVGKKISATLSSVGTPSFFLHPAEAIHGDLGMLARDDLLLAVSNSGESEEMVRLLPVIKRFGLKLIALCGRADSTLARAADVFLDTGVKKEACPWDIVPTSSTTALMAMGDALSIVLMEKKEFKQEDFANFHPGGSLGRGMFVKVKDLMHSGADIPKVAASASMKDVLREISTKRLGVTTVVDKDGALQGIITDGDLRRLMENEADPMSKTAGEILSRSPRTIELEAFGGAAVKLMEDNKITSLVIVSGGDRVEGIVHLHDLLKAGVV